MHWLVVLAIAGCYGPVLPTGAPCATATDCPPPLVCDRGHCEREVSSDGDVDTVVVIDGNPGCVCVDDATIQCNADPPMTCAISCLAQDEGARCAELTPSNGVAVALTGVTGAVTVAGDTIFDTATGEITGSVTRAAGPGVIAGIGYAQQVFAGAPLGVFTFDALTVSSGAAAQLVGDRAGVFVVATTATILGTIELSAECQGDRSCPGPGGGAGATTVAARGCGPGGAGQSDPNPNTGGDAGGGGGGGGAIGGAGGSAGPILAGARGIACLAADNEPLVGGSGGGGGGPGSATANPPRGGGGGGAFQLTALERVVVSGDITASGGGGAGGIGALGSSNNASAGSGGGAGGAILIEAPVVVLMAGSNLSANGGGGGGGGVLSQSGSPGGIGLVGSTPANGGAGAGGVTLTRGGNGGAGTTSAGTAADVAGDRNAGGGGGAVGRIFVRALQLSNAGASSPPAGSGPLRSN